MSVLIKNMDELPKDCFLDDCPCRNGENGYCQADKEKRSIYGYRPFWCPLSKISDEVSGRLIRFNDIKIITAPIAPILKGEKVHYEGIAFLNQILEIPEVKAIPMSSIEEMIQKIEEINEFSRDEIEKMYMQDILNIIKEYCGMEGKKED